jgi:hypothetical protein
MVTFEFIDGRMKPWFPMLSQGDSWVASILLLSGEKL